MKQLTLISLFAFFTAGCATLPSRASEINTPETKWSEVSRDPEFPYSEIGLIYQTVLDAMTKRYFREFPDLDAEHTEAMREFIRKEQPKAKFITLMVRDQAVVKWTPKVGQRGTVLINEIGTVQHVQETTPA